MRRLLPFCGGALVRCFSQVPWESPLPPPTHPCYQKLGKHLLEHALASDSGPVAYAECAIARSQLEMVARSLGYDHSIYVFGGLSMLSVLELAGDVDFAAIGSIEPQFGEASEIVGRLTREMRRLGLKATAVPKARIPVVKVDRVSRVLPGSPLHPLALFAVFQCCRALTVEEKSAFFQKLKKGYSALEITWNPTSEFATVKFPSSTELLKAITNVSKFGVVDIPLRLPLEPRYGVELYRYPFDLCLVSSGVKSSNLLRHAFREHPFIRHLLIVLKKWGRACGIVNPFDGLLAAYAIVLMVTHLAVKTGRLAPIRADGSQDISDVPKIPEYRRLEEESDGDPAELGYLFCQYFHYYSSVFNYRTDVVCAMDPNITKAALKWVPKPGEEFGKPPFYHFAIRDMIGVENVARNLNAPACKYIHNAHRLAMNTILKDLSVDTGFLATNLLQSPPQPEFIEGGPEDHRSGLALDTDPSYEALRMIKRAEFHQKKDKIQRFGQNTMRRVNQAKAAQEITRSVMDWIEGANTK